MEVDMRQVQLAGGLGNIISAAKAAMFEAYGGSTLCSGQFIQSTVVQVWGMYNHSIKKQGVFGVGGLV